MGHVFDLEPNGTSRLDIDFMTVMSSLLVFWEGFYDPHSAIKEYFVSIGSCPGCGDVIEEQSVGMTRGIAFIIFLLVVILLLCFNSGKIFIKFYFRASNKRCSFWIWNNILYNSHGM